MQTMCLANEIYRSREQGDGDFEVPACFPPTTLDSTGLPSEGKSFRSMFELKLV